MTDTEEFLLIDDYVYYYLIGLASKDLAVNNHTFNQVQFTSNIEEIGNVPQINLVSISDLGSNEYSLLADIITLGDYLELDAYFEYRKCEIDSTFVSTDKNTYTELGSFSETITLEE